MRFISLSIILVRKEYLAKMHNLPNHHGSGPPEARGPMQSHRLKAGPGWLSRVKKQTAYNLMMLVYIMLES